MIFRLPLPPPPPLLLHSAINTASTELWRIHPPPVLPSSIPSLIVQSCNIANFLQISIVFFAICSYCIKLPDSVFATLLCLTLYVQYMSVSNEFNSIAAQLHQLKIDITCRNWRSAANPPIVWRYVFPLGLECDDICPESKKQDTNLSPITFPNVNRFSKFFHWRTQ